MLEESSFEDPVVLDFNQVKFSYVYLSDVIETVEKQWKGKMMPHVMTKEEMEKAVQPQE
jgi:hypothetical protein